ncbi:hypothetical protein CBR_g28619 [Chara braunii]|uniref:Uncharacterized protein n=1 Tax=Chara braunii TaxID=69332 RepID=A0A388L9B8_CHABU|nr:hypothetical protein CBR_g28619 [Chara braunii]|eukprot:GBG78905.1 hypothetical protein CBR_g28619 [Chara braunii]
MSGKRRAPGREYSPPPFVVLSPRWSGSSLSGVRGRESGAGEVGSGVRGRESGAGEVGYGRHSEGDRDNAGSMPPPPARASEAGVDAEDQTAAPGVAHSGGSPPTVRGGVGGGWSAVRRVGDRLWEDYDAERGVFAGRTAVQTQAAEGGSGRPSLQMAGRMLGLSRAEMRRSLVLEAAGTSTDMLQGQQYTSGGEGLLMRPGTRQQRGLSEVEAPLAAEIAAGRPALDAIQRERGGDCCTGGGGRGCRHRVRADRDCGPQTQGTGGRGSRCSTGGIPHHMAARPPGEAARALERDDDVHRGFSNLRVRYDGLQLPAATSAMAHQALHTTTRME